MKWFHYLNFVLIFLVIVGVCIFEDILVSKTLSSIEERCLYIEKIVDQEDNLKNMIFVLAIDNLEYDWDHNEEKLCYLVNHKSIQEIGQEIAKLKLYISDDDVASARVSLELIKFYCHSYSHFMGSNIHNVL